MIEQFIKRENEIFNILAVFKENGLNFILIGGYAVSAFKHRFSIDADIVIKEKDLQKFKDILKENKYGQSDKKFENAYGGKFESHIKKEKLAISVDLLINGVMCRQTDAFWEFDLFEKNSVETEITGIEKSIEVKIPAKELIIAIKLHSGRLTDIRDIVVLSEDINSGKVVDFSMKGDLDKLNGNIAIIERTLANKNFTDSFKGVFSLEKLPENNFKILKETLDKLKKRLR